MVQYFKGDPQEVQIVDAGSPVFDTLSTQKSLFFDDAYACHLLGELLYDTERAPLSNAIPRDIFRTSFAALFDSFLLAGSFESYLTVFRQIFGETVEVEFTVPAPGKLNIDITATGFETSNFVARRIVENAYIFEQVITQDGLDNLVFQTVKGFESQYELEQMLFEMVPAGIYTEITLSIEGE